MLSLKEFITGLKTAYGAVNVTLTNVEEISSLSIAAPLLVLDSKMIVTDGNLSSHKTELFNNEDDSVLLKSSVNVKKASWLAVASIGIVSDEESKDDINTDIVVNVAITVIGDKKFEDICDETIKNYMRV